MNFKDVALPKRMRAMARDGRGYPIPFIVQRNTDGVPEFAVNDGARQRRAALEKRCPICGTKLDKIFWFVGGPLSAFHERGAYMDTAMHRECMEYALRVCPYLAAPKFLREGPYVRDYDKLPTHLVDNTMIKGQPPVFVAVVARAQEIVDRYPMTVLAIPAKPFVSVEFWHGGEKLTEEAGMKLVSEDMEP